MPTTKELFRPFLVAAAVAEEEEEKKEVFLPLEEETLVSFFFFVFAEKEHEQQQREAKLIMRPKDIFLLCSKSAAKRSQNEKISRKKEKLPFFHVFS